MTDPALHEPQPFSRLEKAALCAILLALTLLAGYRLDARWLRGDEGYAGAQHHAIARHLVRHGPLRIRFAQFRVFHDIPEKELFDDAGDFRGQALRERYQDRFWVSRLPLGSLFHAASLAAFGDREGAIRLVPLAAAVLMVLAVALLMRRRFGHAVALLCAAVLALTPGTVLHARLAGYELPCLALVTVTVLLYDRYREGLTRWTWVWLAMLATGLMGWFGLYLVPLLLVESFRLCPAKRVSWLQRLSLLAVPLIVVGLYAAYMAGLGQDMTERVRYFWEQRSLGGLHLSKGGMSLSSSRFAESFGPLEYLYQVQKFFLNHITILPVLFALGWGVWRLVDLRRGPAQRETRIVLLLGFFAALCYLVTIRSSYVHRYYVIWWLPVLGVAGGCFLARLSGLYHLPDQPAYAIGDGDATLRAHPSRLRWYALVLLLAGLLGSSVYKVMRHHAKAIENEPLMTLMEQAGTIAGDEPCVVQGVAENANWLNLSLVGIQAEVDYPYRVQYDHGDPALFYFWRQPACNYLKVFHGDDSQLELLPIGFPLMEAYTCKGMRLFLLAGDATREKVSPHVTSKTLYENKAGKLIRLTRKPDAPPVPKPVNR